MSRKSTKKLLVTAGAAFLLQVFGAGGANADCTCGPSGCTDGQGQICETVTVNGCESNPNQPGCDGYTFSGCEYNPYGCSDGGGTSGGGTSGGGESETGLEWTAQNCQSAENFLGALGTICMNIDRNREFLTGLFNSFNQISSAYFQNNYPSSLPTRQSTWLNVNLEYLIQAYSALYNANCSIDNDNEEQAQYCTSIAQALNNFVYYQQTGNIDISSSNPNLLLQMLVGSAADSLNGQLTTALGMDLSNVINSLMNAGSSILNDAYAGGCFSNPNYTPAASIQWYSEAINMCEYSGDGEGQLSANISIDFSTNSRLKTAK